MAVSVTEAVLSPYTALLSVFASHMALQRFYFSYVFISPETSHLMVEDYSSTVREREHPALRWDLDSNP